MVCDASVAALAFLGIGRSSNCEARRTVPANGAAIKALRRHRAMLLPERIATPEETSADAACQIATSSYSSSPPSPSPSPSSTSSGSTGLQTETVCVASTGLQIS